PPKSLTALLRCYHPVLIIADDRLRVIGIHGRLASSQPTKRACGGDSSDSLFPSKPTQVFSPHPRPLPLKGPDAQYTAEISDGVRSEERRVGKECESRTTCDRDTVTRRIVLEHQQHAGRALY